MREPPWREMPIDIERLIAARRRVDCDAGLEEEFVQLTLGRSQTVGVLARPRGPSRPDGWVICHSFGIEQMNLDRLDVTVARALAGAGFAVLRFHVPGYGDSATRGEPVTAANHLESTTDAIAVLRELARVERVGVCGARFGAMVAALVADRQQLPLLAAWQPHLEGRRFLADSFAAVSVGDRIGPSPGDARGIAGLEQELRDRGRKDVSGFSLSLEAFESVAAVDLGRDVAGFRGSALVLGLSRDGSMPVEPHRVAEHLRSCGATVSETALADRWAHLLGQHQFKTLPGGEAEIDTLFGICGLVAGETVRWALDQT